MIRFVVALIVGVLTSPALATPEPVASVMVTRSGKNWTADYTLLERAPVWVFAKSILPRESTRSWRIGSVRVLTPGVKLQRLGNFDALVGAKGRVPKEVRLSFTPFLEDIEAGYDSALAFADGSVALYTGQFKVIPMKSVTAARRAAQDDSKLPAFEHPTLMTFSDRAGPILSRGKRVTRPMLGNDDETYLLFGRAQPMIGPAMTTIMDPGLPSWIADYLNAELPRILGQYRAELGPSPVGQPTLLASWAGPKKDHISLGGSVLPGMVVMTLKAMRSLSRASA